MSTYGRATRLVLVATTLAALMLLGACGREAARADRAPGTPSGKAGTTAASATPTAAPTATPRASAPAATTSPTAAPRGLRVEALLQPRTPVEAGVRLTAPNPTAPAEVTVTARITRPGSYPVHLHGGSCRAPSASLSFLGTLTPGGEGQASLTTSGALPGSATALTFELLDRNELIIDIHDPNGAVVACAEFARGGQQ